MSEEGRPGLGIFDGFEAFRSPNSKDYARVMKDGFVALDTNVLLNLYRYNTQTRNDLLSILEQLGDRLWIPNQVLAEFWRNRESAIHDPQAQAQKTVKELRELGGNSVKVLNAWANRVALPVHRKVEISKVIDESFQKAIDEIMSLVDEELKTMRDTNEDPIVARLEAAFCGRVGAPFPSAEFDELRARGAKRIQDKVPPGYKDREDKEDPLGDFFVWEQLVGEAARRKCDVLFVTADVKEDWWRVVQGQTRGPRPELVQEMRERAGTRLLLSRPESFLTHASQVLAVKVDEASVKDVERVDRLISTRSSQPWSRETLVMLLSRLDAEAPVQASVIRLAAEGDGFVARAKVYEIGEFSEDRSLRGFTRPVRRITQDICDSGVLGPEPIDVLEPVYDATEGWSQATGFRIPLELIPLLRSATSISDEGEGSCGG